MIIRIPLLYAAALFVAVTAGTAIAGPVPSGWSCTGNCGTDGADGSVTLSPSGNSDYEYVSTNGGASGVGELSGVGGTDGSLLATPVFTAASGDALQFYFNFITSDGAGFSDYAWAQLYDSSDNLIATLFTARTQPSGNTSPGFGLPSDDSTLTPATSAINAGATTWSPLGTSSGTCFSGGCGSTGWIQSDYTIATGGDYYVAFGTTNVTDTSFDTGLALDGVSVGGTSIPTDVPEPASVALLSAALCVVALARRRKA